MRILAIDPGDKKSGWLLLQSNGTPAGFGIDPNEDLHAVLDSFWADVLVIEYMMAIGMPCAQQVLDAQFWAGRFVERWGKDWEPMPRREVKLAICGQSRAKDANVRQALIDRFGGKETAIGRKKSPGPLYGISKDVWAALAVAVAYQDKKRGVA